jgi:serine/threonine protein kinase
VALKRFSKRGHDTDEQSRHRVLNEIAVHMEMDHECVAKVVPPGFFECDETNALYLVTEFCSNGTLMDYVKRSRLSGEGKPSGLPESVAQRFFRQLAEGVAYLHTQGVIHRDIKLKNLLLTADMQLKLTDFGVAVWTRCVWGCSP